MTRAYDPKRVAVSALALACFSLGFSVTAAAYRGASGPRNEPAQASSVAQHPTTSAVMRNNARGCRLDE